MSGNRTPGESPFVAPAAVEAWDAWFRWRENGVLRDDTIEATWQRVAATLATVEPGGERCAFERRLLDAFADWRLLLDERILAAAGTEATPWPDDGLVAVLNLAGFVRPSPASQAVIDCAAVKHCAGLAAHALDNAIVLRRDSHRTAKRLRIGVIGLADALALLGLDYACAEARMQARRIAQALAEGSLDATIALAESRGRALRCDAAWFERARLRETPTDLVARARRHGLRHIGLTAITPQPRLARFANDVGDAIHPLATAARGGSGPAKRVRASVPSQLDMRAAMQPWMDESLSLPVQSNRKPSPAEHLDWYARAAALGLGALSWRRAAPAPSPQP
ncbi:MAG: hypothetical protein QM741_12060 [Rudaea sp.]|uniref:hypothetical protein n=1 Tax=Rudaea sp. TaxID=2136325 RepID=UPI0039E2751A